MEQHRLTPDFLAQEAFTPDLAPMYQLTEQQYQAVVNQLSNLTVAIIEHLQRQAHGELAQQIAGQAHGILVNYDEDVAEIILMAGQPPQHRMHAGLADSSRLKI